MKALRLRANPVNAVKCVDFTKNWPFLMFKRKNLELGKEWCFLSYVGISFQKIPFTSEKNAKKGVNKLIIQARKRLKFVFNSTYPFGFKISALLRCRPFFPKSEDLFQFSKTSRGGFPLLPSSCTSVLDKLRCVFTN